MDENNHVLPERSEVVVIGGGVMGAAALHYLVELGCEHPVLARARDARHRLDRPLRGRRPDAVLGRAERPHRLESIRRLRAVRGRGGAGARPAPRRLPLPARRPGRPRAVRADLAQAASASNAVLAPDEAARSCRSSRRAASAARRSTRVAGYRDARSRRAGLCEARGRRAARESSSRARPRGSWSTAAE